MNLIVILSQYKDSKSNLPTKIHYRDTVDKEGVAQIPGIVHEIIYLTAALNTSLNSFVYGAYYY